MRVGIISRWLPPSIGGIVDHSVNLAEALRSRGHDVVLIGSRGDIGPNVHIVEDNWSFAALSRLIAKIQKMGLDHVVLQYTPLTYAMDVSTRPADLAAFWNAVRATVKTSLIVHETYFRSWRRPRSLFRGTLQKNALKALCKASDKVFTASEPLLAEMGGWGLASAPHLLPISSNVPVSEARAGVLRSNHGLSADTIVLTLFGGGNNLKWRLNCLRALETQLKKDAIPYVWLILGGVPRNWLHLRAPVIDPGHLPLEELSAYLQITDVFLMPNWSGVSAKRGTLMAALEHGLPVVGTAGYMTDRRWQWVEGVILTAGYTSESFVDAVMALARAPDLRRRLGRSNRVYFQDHFDREQIVAQLLDAWLENSGKP